MTVHVAPHGRIGWPRWHAERHPAIQRVFGEHRGLTSLVVLAIVAVIAIAGATAALAPGAKQVAGTVPGTQVISSVGAMGPTALRKVLDQADIQAIVVTQAQPATLAVAWQADRTHDTLVRAIKSQGLPAEAALTSSPSFDGKPIPL